LQVAGLQLVALQAASSGSRFALDVSMRQYLKEFPPFQIDIFVFMQQNGYVGISIPQEQEGNVLNYLLMPTNSRQPANQQKRSIMCKLVLTSDSSGFLTTATFDAGTNCPLALLIQHIFTFSHQH
jgi:hypothetical protein